MAEPVTELHLSEYIDIARRRKWWLIVIVALSLTLAIGLTSLQPPKYRAAARVRVEVAASGILRDAGNISNSIRNRNLQNEVEFARSDRVRVRAETEFGGAITITISPSNESDVVTFDAVGSDPILTASAANTFAAAYVAESSLVIGERYLDAVTVISIRLGEIAERRTELNSLSVAPESDASVQIQVATLDSEEAQLRSQLNEIDVLGDVNRNPDIAVLNAASPPNAAFSPSWLRNIALALVAGIILGAGSALVFETLDDTVITKRDLERATDGTPVIGLIPRHRRSRRNNNDRALITSRTGEFTEAFRSLRSAIELGQATGGEIRSILVTSPNGGEGKSTVAAHLAVAFARSGLDVLVIDADMHSPSQHELFGVANVDGLADFPNEIDEAEIVKEQRSGENLVSIIPAGVGEVPPAELLSSSNAHEFIRKLSFVFDLVIVDSPPIRPVADTLPLARIADATLLVAMRGKTTSTDLQQALELLARAQTRPLGTVMNGADTRESGYGDGYGPRK